MRRFSILNFLVLFLLVGCKLGGSGFEVNSQGLGSAGPGSVPPTPYPTPAAMATPAMEAGSGNTEEGSSPSDQAGVPVTDPASYSPYLDALRDIAVWYRGWRTPCIGGVRKTIYATLKRLTIEKHVYGAGSNCTGDETEFATRITFSLANLPNTFSYPMEAALFFQRLELKAHPAADLNALDSATGVVSEMNITGVCGLTNWNHTTWKDVTSTVCWNFERNNGIGDGVITAVTPFVYEDSIIFGPVHWTVSGSTLTYEGETYIRL